MVIGISGKIGSGKDTVGRIIQYLVFKEYYKKVAGIADYVDMSPGAIPFTPGGFIVKKFADRLKDTVCLWTGCTRQQLEDPDFKNQEIGPDWVRYARAIGYGDRNGQRIMWSNTCTKEEYEEEYRTNWQTAYKINLTYRHLLQLLGTECMRNTIHLNGWVNALFSEYKETVYNITKKEEYKYENGKGNLNYSGKKFPNWIITDMRFPNELEAIKSRSGITIRINRGSEYTDEHPSETALDNATFDYVLENNGTIEELVEKVKAILITLHLISNE